MEVRPDEEVCAPVGADDGVCAVVLVDTEGLEMVVGRLAGRRPDLDLVDTLARLQLAARRRGCLIRLRDPCPELCDLLELVGLAGLFGAGPGLPLEAGREAEGREELGVQEVVPPGDPVT